MASDTAGQTTTADNAVVPSFRRDVMPVFFRAGCNSGTCHGSARGKDGFMLSLFGYDPAGDYRRAVEEIPGRRVNVAMPRESLLLLKALGAVPHTGGKRIESDSDLAKT
ncbi:MAG: cell surface protein, partial [Pirellula sp.]